jgi:hypothetical protein
MEVEVLGVMIPMLGIVGIVITIIYLRKYSNEERMAMIDKGMDPSLFTSKRSTWNTSGPLRASLLLIGAGIGLLLGYVLDYNYNMEEVGYFSMLFILGGIGLGIAYIIEERKLRNNQ